MSKPCENYTNLITMKHRPFPCGAWRASATTAFMGLLLISPWLVGLLLFKILPILASLVISFTDFYMLAPDDIHFVGLQNYAHLLDDPAVGYVLFETIALALFTIPLQMVASIFLSALLSSPRLRGPNCAAHLLLPAQHHPQRSHYVHVVRICRPGDRLVEQADPAAAGIGRL